MKKSFIFTALLVLISLAAHASEKLNLVTSLDPLEAREYIMEFEKASGIKVQWIRLAAGEALSRLKSEAKNPTQDIWFGAPSPEFVAAKNAGLLQSYSSSATAKIPQKWRDPENFWTPIYFGAIGFITHEGTRPPTSWEDLLLPEYKGEIVVSYPYTAGTGFTIFAGLCAIMGEEKALEYAKALDANVRRYTKSGGSPIIEVGLGEAGVGIVFEQDAVRKGVSRGFPISVTMPSDGVPFEVGGVAMINGAKDPEPAKKFIDWIVSMPAQNMMQKWFRTPILPSAKIPEGVHKLSEMKLAPMTSADSGLKREEIIRKWREKVGK